MTALGAQSQHSSVPGLLPQQQLMSGGQSIMSGGTGMTSTGPGQVSGGGPTALWSTNGTVA